jgi:cation diffusion facilitator family transporter
MRVISLSVLAALTTIVLKIAAWWVTDSVGLLSDALESGVNLVASLAAMAALWYASRPADADHAYGHEKIEFFSSGLEGGLILAAAVGTAVAAVHRLLFPADLTRLDIGTALALTASAVNLIVARILLRVGRETGSIVLEADGEHLMTDVWTSVGVVVGVVIVGLTGLHWLDPVIALGVAGMITWTGVSLVRRSFDGLMDRALPETELIHVRSVIEQQLPDGTTFHALRTRQAGMTRFADCHLLVPGATSVREAHALADRIEAAAQAECNGLQLTVHIEPIEEPTSWKGELREYGQPPVGGAS